MAKVQKKCRICGKLYTPCSYCENDKMAFHYRTICCSRKCAQVYLERVLEARNTSIISTTSNMSQEIEPTEEVKVIDNTEQENDGQTNEEKPKRKYTKKKKVEVEDSEQIEESVGASD